MKTGKFAFAAVAAIMVCSFVFTGCDNDTTKGIAVTGITLTGGARLGLTVEDTEILSYTVHPANATNKRVSWSSSNPSVVSVTDGILTAESDGTAIITVRTVDGNFTATCLVTVGLVPVESITLDKIELDLYVGETGTLNADIEPENASNKLVAWSTDRAAVATVVNGIVTGRGAGTVTITAKTSNGKTATCEVTVSPITVTGVELDIPGLNMGVWDPQRLTPRVLPENATNKNVIWSSNNTNVATVSTNGTVTGTGKGDAIITVTTQDGGKTATCAVTVTIIVPDIPMVLINHGTFTMGSPEAEEGRYPYKDMAPLMLELYGLDQYWTNETRHQVTLTRDFYMSPYQVSHALYKLIMGNNPSYWDVETLRPELVDVWPVDGVTWYEAVEFCNKLSLAKDLTPVYTITGRRPATGYPIRYATVECNWDANGYRLPTEAEWEYACRAGTNTAFNFREHVYDPVAKDYTGVREPVVWGSDYIWMDWANFVGDDDYNERPTSLNGEWWGHTVPWSGDGPNKWGIYNMHGNLEEWCWDWFDGTDYGAAAVTDPKGLEDGEARALRGGSFFDPAIFVRSAARNGLQPDWDSANWIGFRIVRNVTGPSTKAAVPSAAPSIDEQSGIANQELRILPKSTRKIERPRRVN
jgi:uncharacterized protein YjdB/formylglycine-generating enzyme required for sulfatase activity